MSEIKGIAADIEYLLCAKLRPIFLTISIKEEEQQEPVIEIVISTIAFKNMTIHERVTSVFNLLKKELADIIKDSLIVIQTYSPEELDVLLDEMFSKDLR